MSGWRPPTSTGGAMRQAILPRPIPPRLRLPLLLLVSEQLVFLRIPELHMMHAYRQFNKPDEEKDSMVPVARSGSYR